MFPGINFSFRRSFASLKGKARHHHHHHHHHHHYWSAFRLLTYVPTFSYYTISLNIFERYFGIFFPPIYFNINFTQFSHFAITVNFRHGWFCKPPLDIFSPFFHFEYSFHFTLKAIFFLTLYFIFYISFLLFMFTIWKLE